MGADIAVIVVLGLVLGSFATALAHRLPRDISMISVVHSRCNACRANLGARDLVPVLSWLFLRGKCRQCGVAIGWHYPLMEIATVAVCVLFYTVYGLTAETALIFALAPVLVSAIDIDLRHRIIPDALNLSILLIGAAVFTVNAVLSAAPLRFMADHAGAGWGFLIYGGGAFVLRQAGQMVLKREPLGLGDVKFFSAAGFWLGLNAEAAATFLVLAGGIGTALALFWRRMTGEDEAPFGPALMAAFIVVLYFWKPEFMIY